MKGKLKMLTWIIVGFVLLSAGILITIPYAIMLSLDIPVRFSKTWTAEEFGLQADHLFVKTEDGLNISTFEVAVENPKAVIICLSGICNPSATIYFGHARLFTEHGYATIILDMRAHGESEGSKICLGFKEWLDVKAVVEHIKVKPLYDNVSIIVFGLSMGGATAINAFGELPEINGLISLSAYSSWEDTFYDNMSVKVPKLLALIDKPFVSLVTFLKFGAVSCVIKPKIAITKTGNRPVLLMHSKEDSQVPFASFKRLLRQSPSHIETFIRDGDAHFITDHFGNPEKDEAYADAIISFLNKLFGNYQR